MLKKHHPAFLFLLLAAMPLVFSAYAVIGKWMIEYEMEEKLETENLQKLVVREAEIVWLKNDKEMLMAGEPFDVKNICRDGDIITVWGLFDKMEKELRKKIEDYQCQDDQGTASGNNVLLLLFSSYFINYDEINIHPPVSFSNKPTNIFHTTNYQNPCFSVITPPPRKA